MNEPRISEIADLILTPSVSDAKKRELVQSAFELGVAHGRVEAAERMAESFKDFNARFDAVMKS